MVASGKLDKSKPPVYHAFEQARGWRILREHVELCVDLEQRVITGRALFNLCAINYQFINVALNLRRCRVKSCTVNGVTAAHRFVSPLDDEELLQAVSSERSRHRVRDVERSMSVREEAASNRGELVIDLPVTVSADIIDELDRLTANTSKPEDAPPEPVDPRNTLSVPLEQLPKVELLVEYETLDTTTGAVFYGNYNDPTSVLDPVYMLTESRFGMSRFWMPCVDSKAWCDRHLFDIDVAVRPHDMAIASGELMETLLYSGDTVPHPHFKGPVKVFKYRLHAPAHASELVLAAGPFVALPDPILSKTVTHFCLPGRAHELVHTSPPLFAKALAFCRDYFGAEPPISSFKHVFVGSLGSQPSSTVCGAGGIVVYSGDLLHTARNIDEGFTAREAIMSGLVTSYFGRFLRPRASEDDWLVCGLAAHITALGLQAILGRNWYRFKILDLMDELCTETSVDLSDIQIDRVTDSKLVSVQRRSHVIVYMVERRIGSDVLKRALRDIVAEGRSATIAVLKLIDGLLSGPSQNSNGLSNGNVPMKVAYTPRVLTNLNGDNSEHDGSSVVSSGFDEAQHGVGVGPFLKRLRAICGSDVRGLVRLWASSRGVPRMQIAYQYNPRKHCLELALRQDVALEGSQPAPRQGLLFTGTLHIRVMEVEGASDHTVEVRDPYCLAELPCHSRRAKHKSGSQAEKEFNENPARASPVLWVRIDPDNEWCKDLKFQQTEDSWIALLKGERDAVAQYEACIGLCGSSAKMTTNALLAVLEDEQLYWRVRAMAAKALGTCGDGLNILLRYFRSCYTDSADGGSTLVRPNNFSSLPNYYVKRFMIKAIADIRVPSGSQKMSVPVETAEFLAHLLSSNDNAINEFEDEHYVVDLVDACGKVAISCVGDEMHAKAGEDGMCTTEGICKQLERYRAIEQLMATSSKQVFASITKALCDIEVAKMVYAQRREYHGFASGSIPVPRLEGNEALMRGIQDLSARECPLDIRLDVMHCLAKAYGADLNVALWLLARCDRNSSEEDIIRMDWETTDKRDPSLDWVYVEIPSLRYKILDVLCLAASMAWGATTSPLKAALRRNTRRAMQLCVRILRLVVGDADSRVRSSALRFAKLIWGGNIPVCLLARAEYSEMKRAAREKGVTEATEIVPLKTHGNYSRVQTDMGLRAPKPSKPSKSSKSSKSGKGSKSSKKKISGAKSSISAFPISDERPMDTTPIDVDAVDDGPSHGEIHEEMKDTPRLTPVVDLDPEPVLPKLKVPKSVAASIPRSAPLNVPSIPKDAEGNSKAKQPDTTAKTEGARSTKIVLPRSVPKSSAPKSSAAKPPRAIPKTIPRSVPSNPPKLTSKPIAKSVPASNVVGTPKGSSSQAIKSGSISLPRSVPKIPLSVPNNGPILKAIESYPFSWHPLDSEDTKLFARAVEERKARLSSDRGMSSGVDREKNKDMVQSSGGNAGAVGMNGMESEKKKKKKKKKRHLEGEDGHKKKKKKKKKHRDEGEMGMDQEPDFADDLLDPDVATGVAGDGGSSTGQKKLGKFKIKLNSLPAVENSS